MNFSRIDIAWMRRLRHVRTEQINLYIHRKAIGGSRLVRLVPVFVEESASTTEPVDRVDACGE
jgi:hypothetical protein